MNGKFTSNYKVSPIDLETQISLLRQAPPKISPSKGPLKNISPWAYFRNFTVVFFSGVNISVNKLSFFDDISLALNVRRLYVVVDSRISAAKVCDCVISPWC